MSKVNEKEVYSKLVNLEFNEKFSYHLGDDEQGHGGTRFTLSRVLNGYVTAVKITRYNDVPHSSSLISYRDGYTFFTPFDKWKK